MDTVLEQVWPRTAARVDGEVRLGGLGVGELAAGFGTPAYFLDQEDFRSRCAGWRAALLRLYP